MLSMPPATITSCVPASSMWGASIAAFMPEPHIWLSVTAPALSGSPPLNAAWRAGAWPWPAIRQLPINTSPTVSGARPARATPAPPAPPPPSPAAPAAEVGGGQVGKVALQRPHGGAGRADDDDGVLGGCWHRLLLDWLVWRIVALPARAAPVHAGAGVLTAPATPAMAAW